MHETADSTTDNIKQVRGIGMRIFFEESQTLLDISVHYCLNPECPCRDATLHFYKADERHNAKYDYNDRLFCIVLDYANWKIKSTNIFNEDKNIDCPKLIHEFMSELNDEVRKTIKGGKERLLTASEDVLRENIDYTGLETNTMVYYDEIYDARLYKQLVFEHEGTQYFVMDHYCINPECKCNDVLLAFLVVKDSKALEKPILQIRLNFNRKRHRIVSKSKDISDQFAGELYELLMRSISRKGQSLFEERYARMKEWGAGFVKQLPVTPHTGSLSTQKSIKIGRNEPCPCGSGKKYKKCCGKLS